MMDHDVESRKRRSMGDGPDDPKKAKIENAPSKVVHIRSIPIDASERDIMDLAQSFGPVAHLLHMRSKLQALVQFQQESHATTMVNYYAYVTPVVRGQPVYIQYSTHKELKVAEKQNQARNDDDRDESPANNDPYRGINKPRVLRVGVDHLLYPVTIDVLHQLFSKYGRIEKVVIFTRNEQFNALVQYQHGDDAKVGRDMLDGQNIYNGCNTLRIDYSNLAELTIKANSSRARDFTKPAIPSEPNLPLANPGVLPLPFGAPQIPALLGNGPGHNMPNFNLGPSGPRHGPQRQGEVLLVSNLPEGKYTCDDLFMLFGNYGDVMRVKILFNKQDSALIQFFDGQQAHIAQSNLNGIRFMGKDLCINKSKHSTVNLPKKENEIEKDLTKDYSNSSLHRFKKPGSKNFHNIFPPIRTLHLSNIPETTEESDLVELFKSTGGTVEGFRFFPKDRRMALIKLASIEEALHGIMKHHNHKLSESNHLRVSFAKNDI